MALSTALGCSSHAAAAMSTLSTSERSRPAANAWRRAASEKAARSCGECGCPQCQVEILRPRVRQPRRWQALGDCSALDLVQFVRLRGSPGAWDANRLPDRHGRQLMVHALRSEPALRRGEVEVEDRPLGDRRPLGRRAILRGPAHRQPWISHPSVARAASIVASENVGCGCTIRATSAKPPSRSRTATSSEIRSVARAPAM